MPLRYLTGTTVVTLANTAAVLANTDDIILLAAGAVRGATGTGASDGIVADTGTSGIDVTIEGTVFGRRGVNLEESAGRNSVFVAEGGAVYGTATAVYIDGTHGTVRNFGTIAGLDSGDGSGSVVLYSLADNTIIINEGLISSRSTNTAITTFSSVGTLLVNTGTIEAVNSISGNTAISFADTGSDLIWNTGLIVGSINLGGGNDLYQGGGTVIGQIGISDSSGDDTIIGGAQADRIYDVLGANWLAGGDGDDTIIIGSSNTDRTVDHVFGGVMGGADTSGRDTLDFFSNGTGVNVFLASGVVTAVVGGGVVAWINGFENVTGSIFDDALIGSNGANVLQGTEATTGLWAMAGRTGSSLPQR